jgi:hypothetical protein
MNLPDPDPTFRSLRMRIDFKCTFVSISSDFLGNLYKRQIIPLSSINVQAKKVGYDRRAGSGADCSVFDLVKKFRIRSNHDPQHCIFYSFMMHYHCFALTVFKSFFIIFITSIGSELGTYASKESFKNCLDLRC